MANTHEMADYPFDYLEQRLYSSVIADILDELGFRKQTIGPGVQLLDPELKISGRVFTAQAIQVFDLPTEPYRMQMEAIDAMLPGEVFVAATDVSGAAALWGELVSTACRARGGRGAVLDGLNRDSSTVKEMKFPVASRGRVPTDSKGRVEFISYREVIVIDDVRILPGDYVFADMDGIVFIPQAVESEAVRLALEKVAGENAVRKALREGMLCAEAFRTFGIL